MKRTLLMLAAAALLVVSCKEARNAEGPGLEKVAPEEVGLNSERLTLIDGLFENAIAEEAIPGGVLAIVRHGRIACLKAYGNKSVVPETVPMTTETMFDLASLSKCVGTTLSFMQLVEKGQVRLNDNVSRYIPGFKPWKDPETGEEVEITIQDLMTHSSGLDAYVSVANYVSEYGENCPDSLMAGIAARAGRHFRPGTGFLYSCLNYVTLQNILQNVTGERLCDYAQKNIFDALGLEHTCYFPMNGEKPSKENWESLVPLCAPTEVQADGLPLVAQVHDPIARRLNSGNSGNAGVFSTAEDLCVIAACLMNGGEWNGRRILSPATVKAMFTVPEENSPEVGRALGWDNSSSHASLVGDLLEKDCAFMHTGYTGTSMLMDLENDVAIIILTNRVHPKDTGGLGRLRALTANIVAGALTD